jgi:hypothetical protein
MTLWVSSTGVSNDEQAIKRSCRGFEAFWFFGPRCPGPGNGALSDPRHHTTFYPALLSQRKNRLRNIQ